MTLTIFLFGSPSIEKDDRPIALDTRKAVAMLAFLALTGRRHTRDSLADFLWPDFDQRRSRAALRRTLSSLKTAVDGYGLDIERESLGLDHEADIRVDVLDFRRYLAQVEAHDHVDPEVCHTCLRSLEAAVDLYVGDFMDGFTLRDSLLFDDWQLGESESLRRELAGALEKLVTYLERQGQFEAAIKHARRWLNLDPLREEAQRRLMQLYAWAGRRSDALQQYRACVRVLKEELGVTPLAETTALYQVIQEEQLAAPADSPASGSLDEPSAQKEEVVPDIPLVGRETELEIMYRLYEQVGPDGRLLVITGEAGIGKTRLAETFLSSITDTYVLHSRCYDGESDLAYAPFMGAMRAGLRLSGAKTRLQDVPPSWLAEGARLLPELLDWFPDLPAAPPLEWPGAPARFVEGLSRLITALLAGPEPGVLWLDDIQWADSASLELIAFLARRWRDRPYLILACWRTGDFPADHHLHSALAVARREGSGRLLSLTRMDQKTVTDLAAAAYPAQRMTDGFMARLYRETEGLPFLVVAYLQDYLARPSDQQQVRGMPPTVRDLFRSRLAEVSETGMQLLQAAATIGRAFDFDLLRAVSGRSEEESVPALETLTARFLLQEESGGPLYAFGHQKLREMVYEEMSLVRRRLLHRRAAQALSRGSGTGAPVGQIAAHYQLAGLEAEAADFYQRAGDQARALFAHREALKHYEAALALGHPRAAELHEACADLRVRLGEYQAALSAYEQAVASGDRPAVGRLEHKLGQVHYRRGEWGLAERHFELAEAEWAQGSISDDLVRLYIDWSMTAYRAGDLALAGNLAGKASDLADSPMSRAQTENTLGILARQAGELPTAQEHFERGLDLAETHAFLGEQIAALNNLALTESALGKLDKARTLLEDALERCLAYGDRHWEAGLRNNLADLLHKQGQKEASMAQLKQAVTIYAEIGRETGEWQPEIWKLAEW